MYLGLGLVLEDLHGDLDLAEGLEQRDLALDGRERVDDRRLAVAKVVRDLGVEPVARVDDGQAGRGAGGHERLDLLERFVACLDLLLGQLAERRLAGVVVHLHHRLLHRLDVGDELDERLDARIELGLGLLLGRARLGRSGGGGGGRGGGIGGVALVVDRHDVVLARAVRERLAKGVARLVLELGQELGLGRRDAHRALERVLAGAADTAPALPAVVLVPAVGREQLDDVKLVVALDVEANVRLWGACD